MANNVEIILRLKDQATKQLDKVNKSFRQLGESSKKVNGDGLKRVASGASAATKGMTSLKTAVDKTGFALFKTRESLQSLFALFGTGVAVSRGLGLDRALAEVSTLTDNAAGSMENLRASVLKLSSAFGTDSVNTAKAMYQAISAGASAGAEANTLMAAALKAAKAGVTDALISVDAITSVANAYKISMTDASDISDSFFVTVRGGKTTFEELGRTIANVSPIASAVGAKFDDVNAAIATLTLGGTKTSVATTQIRAALQGLLRPTEELQAIFADFGGAQELIKTQGLKAAFDVIAQAAEGDIGKLTKLVGSIEGVNGILGLTGKNAAAFSKALEDQANRAGATDKAFAKIESSLSDRFSAALEKLNNLLKSVGQALLRVVTPVVEGAAAVAEFTTQVLEANPVLASAVSAFGSLAAIFGTIVTFGGGLGGIAIVVSSIGTAIAATLTKAVALSTAMAGLVARGLSASLAGVTKGIQLMGAAMAGATTAASRLALALKATGIGFIIERSVAIMMAAYDALNAKLEASKSVAAAQEQQLKTGTEAIQKHAAEIEQVIPAAYDKYKAAVASGTLSSEELAAAQLDLLRNFNKARNGAVTLGSTLNSVLNSFDNVSTIRYSADIVAQASAARTGIVSNFKKAFNDSLDEAIKFGLDADVALNTRLLGGIIITAKKMDDTLRTAVRGFKQAVQVNDTFKGLKDDVTKVFNTIANAASKAFENSKANLETALKSYNQLVTQHLDNLSTAQSRTQEFQKAIADLNGTNVQINGFQEGEKLKKQTEEILALNKQINAEQDPAKKQALVAQAAKLADLASSRYSFIKSQDVSAAKALAFQFEKLNKAAIQTEKLREGIIPSDKVKAAENAVKSLSDQVEYYKNLVSDLSDTKIRLEASTNIDEVGRVVDDIVSKLDTNTVVKIKTQMDTSGAAEGFNAFLSQFNGDNSSFVTLNAKFNPTAGDELRSQLMQEHFEAIVYANLDAAWNAFYNFKAMVESTKVMVNFSAGGLAGRVGAATGGLITGPGTGTSDSIPANLSNGEFVMRAAAVARYGVSFMNMLNNMTLPAPSVPPTPSLAPSSGRIGFASGGLVSSNRDVVDINFNIGGKRVALTGARDQVEQLAVALNSVAQGAA